MDKEKITPVILAGGQGKRLWPLSRPSKPKQFLRLTGHKTIFELTCDRCNNPKIFNPPIIIGNVRHKEILNNLAPANAKIILEPYSKNTCASIALALDATDPNETLLIMPSDHVITNQSAFINSIRKAQTHTDKLVTFGIAPTSAHTGYGYIQKSNSHAVQRFHEKPSKKIAQSYINDNSFFWNSGIFMASHQVLTKEYQKYAPQILEAIKHEDAFKNIPPISFDCAIAEKTKNAAMIPAEFTWSDIGSWGALLSLKTKRRKTA